MIDSLRQIIANLPQVTFPIVALAAVAGCAILVHGLLFRALTKATERRVGLGVALIRQARRPLRLSLVLFALILTLPNVSLPYGVESTVRHGLLVMLVVLVGWTLIVLLNYGSERAMSRYRIDTEDNLQARKNVTQVRVLRRAASIIIFIVTLASALMTFESVQEYGLSLFASAGAAGLILGFAARPVLANLIAGIQIAITQPIRIEDVVIVEGEWGWIEEIYATYVVVRVWDWRRLVVPLSYFIEKPFQNWTREGSSVIGTVYWYMDYTVPIEKVREKLGEFLETSPYWDGEVSNLQVVDTDKDTIHLRGLMSARTAPQAWDLRCEIRERILVWLQAEYPQTLPRLRGELDMRPPAAAGRTEQGAK